MEVLLLQDVPNVGKRDDLMVVGDGYALNFLLPHNLAIVATPKVRQRYAERIRERAVQREAERQAKQGALVAAEGKEITFARKATKTGKLYGAISEDMIAQALKEQCSIDVDSSAITVPTPIKSIGTSTVTIEIQGNKAELSVVVKQEVD